MKEISVKIARRLLKVAGKTENDALSRWENASAKNATFLKVLQEFWDSPGEEKSSDELCVARDRILTRIQSSEIKAGRKSLIFYLTRFAAILLFALCIAALSVYLASESNFHKSNWIKVSTEAGQQSKVTLPDGSSVWLNAGSVIQYLPGWKKRIVSLTGEAYFEVCHLPNLPFVVETDDAKIKVVGTKFNVSHYPGSNITEASLLSGKIVMSLNKGGNVIDMVPGEKVTYNALNQKVVKIKAKVQNDILWRQGILVFENVSFNDLILKLGRYYAIKFQYDKDAFQDIHYTGTINNLNISKVLDFLSLTIPINYEINNKDVKLNLRN